MDSREIAWRAYASEHGWEGEEMSTEDIIEMALAEIDTAMEYDMDMTDITEEMMAWAEMHR